MVKPIELELNSITLQGTATDNDAMFFSSLYYDEAERGLADKGLTDKAFERLCERLKSQVEQKQKSDRLTLIEADRKVTTELALYIREQIEGDWSVRKNVTWRIKEIFPDIPPEMVYWRSDSSFGIRLDMKELLTLFMSIIGTVFDSLPEDSEVTANEPVVIPQIESPNPELNVRSGVVTERENIVANPKAVQQRSPEEEAIRQKIYAEMQAESKMH